MKDDTVTVEFETREAAVAHLTAEGFTFDRHETYGFTSGVDFYSGKAGMRAGLREKAGKWQVVTYNGFSPRPHHHAIREGRE